MWICLAEQYAVFRCPKLGEEPILRVSRKNRADGAADEAV